LIDRQTLRSDEVFRCLDLLGGWGTSAQCSTKPQTASIVCTEQERSVTAIIEVRDIQRTSRRSAKFVPHERRFRHAPKIFKIVRSVEGRVAVEFIDRTVE